jgi:alkylation response protein AidB-like acyl-CoA dehydrogenase
VKDAHVADHLLVVVRGNGSLHLVLVERDQSGVTLLPLEVMSGEKLFEVVLHNVPVWEDMPLGPAGKGWEYLDCLKSNVNRSMEGLSLQRLRARWTRRPDKRTA